MVLENQREDVVVIRRSLDLVLPKLVFNFPSEELLVT
jgi:hypothetical protein